MNYKDLREKYPVFTYESFNYEIVDGNLLIEFSFRIDSDISFKPKLVFKDVPPDRFSSLSGELIENFVFHLGLTEIPTYWKTVCSPKILVSCGNLDSEQIDWWKDLFVKGMGQFFYENKIDFTHPNFIEIESISSKKYSAADDSSLSGVLIPIGGGKDSAVTTELLKELPRVSGFFINPTKAALDVFALSNLKNMIIVERKIDDNLIRMNAEGYLNGHTPFSAVVAFEACFGAYVFGYKDVVLSNERSSDEENTIYLGKKINHQYSKTFEFENKFREYLKKYLININYFSFLRPIYEIQIAKIFSGMKRYFDAIRSCNIGQKTNTWCSNCSKCLSTYILFKPFMREEDLSKIFGEDLLTKASLKETLSELIDEGKVKPFECVGTREELKEALRMEKGKSNILSKWNDDNNLAKEYEEILKTHL